MRSVVPFIGPVLGFWLAAALVGLASREGAPVPLLVIAAMLSGLALGLYVGFTVSKRGKQ